jgi:hypothetical protein
MNDRRWLVALLIVAPPIAAFAAWLNLQFYPQLPAWYVWGGVTILMIAIEVIGIRALAKR